MLNLNFLCCNSPFFAWVLFLIITLHIPKDNGAVSQKVFCWVTGLNWLSSLVKHQIWLTFFLSTKLTGCLTELALSASLLGTVNLWVYVCAWVWVHVSTCECIYVLYVCPCPVAGPLHGGFNRYFQLKWSTSIHLPTIAISRSLCSDIEL
jgi:hypothetical protein